MEIRVPAISHDVEITDTNSKFDPVEAEGDLWDILAPYLAPATIRRLPRSEWAESENSTVFDAFSANPSRLDVTSAMWSKTEQRDSNFRPTDILYSVPLVVEVMGKSETSGDNQSLGWILPTFLIQMFDSDLWVSVLGVFFLMLLANAALGVYFRKHNVSQWSIWHWFTHYTQQDTKSDFPYGSVALALLLLLTATFTIHSLVLYQGCLLGQLVRKQAVVIKTISLRDLAELIERREAVLNLLNPSFAFSQQIYDEYNSNHEFQLLRQALTHNPPIYEPKVSDEDPRRIATKRPIHYAVSRSDCELEIIGTTFKDNMVLYMPLSISEQVSSALNEAIRAAKADIVGYMEQQIQRPKESYKACRLRKLEQAQPKEGDPIPFVKLSGMLAIWLVGMCAAFAAFVVEWLRKKRAVSSFA